MRISDWSSDVCSSDLYLGGCRESGIHQIHHAVDAVHPGLPDEQRIAAQRAQHLDVVGGLDAEPAAGELRPREEVGAEPKTGALVERQDRKSTRLNSSH